MVQLVVYCMGIWVIAYIVTVEFLKWMFLLKSESSAWVAVENAVGALAGFVAMVLLIWIDRRFIGKTRDNKRDTFV